jgi:glycosyltransferase involved in cell wall biosynthesis
MDKPLVSVVIPTFNSEKTIGKCLDSIKNQTYKNVEIIIVDKNSNDKTVEIAKRYGARVFVVDAKERSEQKNFGIKKAKGKYVLFLDSDMELTPKVIEECYIKINSENVGGLIIPERSIGNSFWVKVRDFERRFYSGTEIESARFFKTSLVKRVRGFDEEMVFFEESTLPQQIQRLGYSVKVRINSEILHHEENFSLFRWLKKKYYYGKTAFIYRKKYKIYANKQMSLFYRFSIFFSNKRFYSRPILAFGLCFLKILEYFSAGLGFLVSKVRK